VFGKTASRNVDDDEGLPKKPSRESTEEAGESMGAAKADFLLLYGFANLPTLEEDEKDEADEEVAIEEVGEVEGEETGETSPQTR